jgi:hypothetical protein
MITEIKKADYGDEKVGNPHPYLLPIITGRRIKSLSLSNTTQFPLLFEERIKVRRFFNNIFVQALAILH